MLFVCGGQNDLKIIIGIRFSKLHCCIGPRLKNNAVMFILRGLMSFFNFGKPKWYRMLPEHFQPNKYLIQEIENFRSRFSLDHDFLALLISMTPWSVKNLQWFMLNKFRIEQPHLSEKEIWKAVLISRMNVKLMTIDFPTDIGSTPLSKAEIDDIIEQAETIVENFNNFEEVVNYILEIDYKENRFYDPGGLLDDLNNILESRWR